MANIRVSVCVLNLNVMLNHRKRLQLINNKNKYNR